MMTCGHRGKPSRQEEKRISRLLRKSGFIPMLEEIYGVSPGAGAQGDAENQKDSKQSKFKTSQPKTETPKYVGPKMFSK
jgi:hypothetical protein